MTSSRWIGKWERMWRRIGNVVLFYGGSCPWERLWPVNDNDTEEE